MRSVEVREFVATALECTLYVSPTEPGLTLAELNEVGKPLGFQQGEIADAARGAAAPSYSGDKRLHPIPNPMWNAFHFREEPEYRSVEAFDFVCEELAALVRSEGTARARIDRAVLVERAVSRTIPTRDVQVAIVMLTLAEHLVQDGDVIRLAPGREGWPTASEQLRQSAGRDVFKKEMRRKVYPIVLDIVERRTDGRPPSAEPLDAFAEQLEKLGYAPFRLWWTQTVAELRRQDSSLAPLSAAVLSAALVEAALTFVVKHARSRSLAVFASKDFDGDPRSWKIDDLVKSASTGRDGAVLDAPARHRADALIKVRQRIHAGRMLSEYPQGVPDLRPEEARDAKSTADLVVRSVIDWLQRYPPQ